MALPKITILGSSLDYSSNHLVSELCQLDKVEIKIYDVNKKSELGLLGSKLACQASALHPTIKISCNSDIEECLNTDVVIIWGFYFPPSKTYNAVYREFFSGKFKEAVLKHSKSVESYRPSFIFLRSNSSGLIGASILGKEIASLKESIYVLDSISDGRDLSVYPKSDGTFKEVSPWSSTTKLQIENLKDVNGGMMDVDCLLTCVKGILFENKSPRELFDYVGVFPNAGEQQRFKLKGNSCLFMPIDEEDNHTTELQETLQAEDAAMNAFFN